SDHPCEAILSDISAGESNNTDARTTFARWDPDWFKPSIAHHRIPLESKGIRHFWKDACQIRARLRAPLWPRLSTVRLIVDAYVLVGHDLASPPIAWFPKGNPRAR